MVQPASWMRNSALLATALILGACAAPEPTLGEKLQGRGQEIQKIGKTWSQGDAMIAQGHQLVTKGNKKIVQGRSILEDGTSQVREGENLIEKGRALKQAAESSYEVKARNPVEIPY